MHEASYYEKLPNNYVRCFLCPHHCRIKDGAQGICRVRTNQGGVLYSDNYATACCIRFDPIEKKPLYHFYPGSLILSVGTVGCNLRCKFCQNWEISQSCVNDYPYLKNVGVEEVLKKAGERKDNAGIAYTYNEPTIWFEYMLDIAKKAKEQGMHNVSVTNGYIDQEPLAELLEYMDAFNVDLKAFTEEFYRKLTSARLTPVKETIKAISTAGKHLELTHLIIPGYNDRPEEFEEMVTWIAGETGKNTPLHLSRYFPDYQLDNKSTPVSTLLAFYETAVKYLNYVYIGNVDTIEGRDTTCPNCGNTVIERSGYMTYKTGLTADGKCKKCGEGVVSYI